MPAFLKAEGGASRRIENQNHGHPESAERVATLSGGEAPAPGARNVGDAFIKQPATTTITATLRGRRERSSAGRRNRRCAATISDTSAYGMGRRSEAFARPPHFFPIWPILAICAVLSELCLRFVDCSERVANKRSGVMNARFQGYLKTE
jgi:hypothetical protein